MQTRLQKWGNSLALRIPKPFAAEIGLQPDGAVEISIEKGSLVVTPVAEAEVTLEALLAGVTPENIHGAVDFGPPAGQEAW